MKDILDYLAANRERFVAELCDYVRFPSVSAQPSHARDVRACAEWVAGRCRTAGLEVEVKPTPGNPVVVARTAPYQQSLPTFLVYGHYDVQPPEPLELWTSPPFEPRIDGRRLYARGASDNKGQHLAHINAVEAWLKSGHPLPCNLIFLIEGEEEVGSEHLEEFLKRERKRLGCDAVVISDNGIPSLRHPALTYSLRGIVAIEVRLDGPSRDLHSGLFGGTVENPAMALCRLLAQMRDDRGRITIPGIYDEVARLTPYERRQMNRLPFSVAAYRRLTGSPRLFGEPGFTPEEQRTARPTIEINGLTSGYQGVGSKTIIPSWASAKITLRLVPNQEPRRVLRAVLRHFRKCCPPTVRMTLTAGHSGEPYLVSPDRPRAQAALRAIEKGFGRPACLMREGGSIPIVNQFRRILGADTLLLGMALPDDNAHSPNEKFDLDAFDAGMRMAAHLWPELSAIGRGR